MSYRRRIPWSEVGLKRENIRDIDDPLSISSIRDEDIDVLAMGFYDLLEQGRYLFGRGEVYPVHGDLCTLRTVRCAIIVD